MKAFFARAAGWFTDARRAAVQALITAALTLLVVLGHVTAEQSTALAAFAAALLLTAQGVIGLSLLRPSEVFTWFNTAGRGVIYGTATALGPVGLVFNLWGTDAAAQIVTVAGVLVSILTAFVQVVNTQTLTPAAVPLLEVADEIQSPEWWAPLSGPRDATSGLRVAIYSPFGLDDLPEPEAVRELFADPVATIIPVVTLIDFWGASFDAILSTVPLTRGLLDELAPAVATSTLADRVRYIG